MRLLHVSDTHLGADGWFRGAPRGWRRADDHFAALRAALAPALEGEVDLVVHTGDLFDRSRPPARAVVEARALLADVARRVPLVVMPGNHDRRGLRGHLGEIAGVEIVDRPARVRVAGVVLAVVPWIGDAATWAAAARDVWSDGADLLLAHEAFDGARVPRFVFRAGARADTVGARHLPRGVRHVLCGHIHPRQVTRVGEAAVVQPGATERTALSERHEPKGAALWTLEREVTWRWLDTPARPMVAVQSVADLDAVTPGALVHLGSDVRTSEIEAAAIARGGWVAPWKAPTGQVGLFG